LVVRRGAPTLRPELLRMLPTFVLWVAFFGYWGIAARNAAPTKGSESARSTLVHQMLLACAILLLLPIPGLTARFLPRAPLYWAVGLAIQAASACLGVWARIHLGRNWSSEVRIAVDHQLIRSGPYRVLRHPIYTAMLGMFLGTAVTTGEVHALLALVI